MLGRASNSELYSKRIFRHIFKNLQMTVKFTTRINDLWQFVAASKPQIERALEHNLPFAPSTVETEFNAAVRYAVFPGGKRLRPVLTLLGAELFGGQPEDVLNAASAASSL